MKKSYCGTWGWRSPEGVMSPCYCGRATCDRERCQKHFHRERIKLLDALVKEHNLIRFFTLTVNREIPEEIAWDVIHDVWVKFRHRMQRRFGDIWKFVAILESHKDGYPHIHGFTSVWMSQDDWSKMWSESGGGKIVWVEKVKESESVSKYAAKELQVARYCGKENIRRGQVKKGEHRTLWRSKNTKAEFELQKKEGWSIIKKRVFDEEGNLVGDNNNGMERTRCAVSESGVKEGFKELETETSKHE